MRSSNALVGFLLLVTLCQAAVVPRRSYRNSEEILVPVAIVQDGEDKLENAESQAITNLQTETVAVDLNKADIDAGKKHDAAAAVVEAQRRIDDEIIEEEINEAIQEEQQKEIFDALEEEQIAEADEESEISAPYKENPVAEKEPPTKVVVIVQANSPAEVPAQPELPAQPEVNAQPEESEQPAGPDSTVRQATQATPTQTTTQTNFVQQLIQNSPLGQFFNQITGQTSQVANDDTSSGSPLPTVPGLFNPVTAVQTAAQTVVNSTTQAFAGLQQFASNLGNQFQSTLSGLTGQQANDATTARPPGPIQQLVSSIIGGNAQQEQPAPTQQGPLQGLLNIFQGNRPQTSTAAAAAASNNQSPPPAEGPRPLEQANENSAQSATDDLQPDILSNEIRESSEANDSFEQSVQPDEVIVVNDDPLQIGE